VTVAYQGDCGLAGNNSGTLTVSGTGVSTPASATFTGHYNAGTCQ
jgi:hypothetical protein